MADLGALLEKLGRNAGMAPSEIMQLRQKGRDLDAVGSVAGSWFRGGGQDPHFSYMSADQGHFSAMPIDLARVGTNANQTISNNTLTALTSADAVTPTSISRSEGIGVNVAEGSIDVSLFGPDQVVYFFSRVIWDPGPAGRRRVELRNAVTNGFLVTLSDIDYTTTPEGVQTGFYSLTTIYSSPIRAQLNVLQTSGGDLDVTVWRLDAFRVR